MLLKPLENEVRIGTTGNVDAGKTTFTGIFISDNKNYLDDGKGLARSTIFAHKHEKDSGRTSSIKSVSIKSRYNNNDITLIDLAGHEKYLKTTMKGINYNLSYITTFIAANDGFQRMTQQHLTVGLALKIPIIIVITKIDLAPKSVFNNTILKFESFLKKKTNKKLLYISSFDDLKIKINDNKEEVLLTDMSKFVNIDTIPVFIVSNKTGKNLETLKYFLHNLKSNKQYDRESAPHFIIEKKYDVHGVGTVVTGFLRSGTISVKDKLLLGSFNRKFYEITIKGIHGNHKNTINTLYAGQGGCLNITLKEKLHPKHRLKYGLHIMKNIEMYSKFKARIQILHHPSVIKPGYESMLCAESIEQNIKFIKILDADKDALKSGDIANVVIEFRFHQEFIKLGSRIVFRDGSAKGYGYITELLK